MGSAEFNIGRVEVEFTTNCDKPTLMIGNQDIIGRIYITERTEAERVIAEITALLPNFETKS